ncbi:putative UV resistance protein, partial [Pseudomonas syringae pv. actinidiae ICMP 19101]
PTLLQVLSGRASGGFPSPAADHYEAPISLDDLVDLRAPHVWLGETEGDSMSPAGILNGTKLVIDRARTPQGLEEIEVFGVVTWSLTLHVP